MNPAQGCLRKPVQDAEYSTLQSNGIRCGKTRLKDLSGMAWWFPAEILAFIDEGSNGAATRPEEGKKEIR